MIRYTLSKSVFGAELKSSDIEELIQVCTLLTLSKDEFLFHQGDPAKYFYVVHSGAMKVQRIMPDGREQVIHIFKPWESFAEIALSGINTYPVGASAVEASQVVCLDCAKLSALVHRIPDLSLRIIASMSLHLKFLVGKLERQKFQQADGKLASWILEQASGGGEASFELKVKKKNVAAQLGVTSETFSRILNQFKKQGWLQEDQKTWTLLDPVSLRNCAESYNPDQE